MKTKPFILIAALCGIAGFVRAQDLDSMAPVVIKTVPEAGAKDVSPGITEINVTFSKEMTDGSWSWAGAWDNSAPDIIGKPHYEADHKTCVIKVKLEPGTTYGWWLNSQKFHGFQDAKNHPAVPYLLTFATSDASAAKPMAAGNTTQAPASAVQAWLTLVDTGFYPQSWETAADSFHDEITKNDWTAKLEKVRTPLGKLVSRKEVSAQPSQTLPRMPRGSYFVAQFETSFAELTNAVETVVFIQEKDGQWRAVYYLIRPRTAEQTAAVMAAQSWLAGIDAGNYAASWGDAAGYFQGAITQDQWASALESARKPLGELIIRTVNSAVTQTQMPGAPDGRYVVLQFETAFASKHSATETVTFVLEKDGQWKADGYYIK